MATGSYDTRWKALKELLDREIATYGKVQHTDRQITSQLRTLGGVASCLKAFAAGQYRFFHPDGPYRLEKSTRYPFEHVHYVLLDQVSSELDVIQRAAQQRRVGVSENTEVLKKADELAWLALRPAMELKWLLPDTTVVTYFQKSARIRVIPYAPVALIGIPFASTSVPQDFLATPHEVGHHVYWRGYLGTPGKGKFVARIVEEALESAKIAPWAMNWVEEIFADIYGCLVAGSVMAQDFQEILSWESWADFTTDDGEHPVPAARPQIYTQVLRQRGKEEIAQLLETHWGKFLRARGVEAEQARCTVGNTNAPLSEVRAELRRLVDVLLNNTQVFGTGYHWPMNWANDEGVKEESALEQQTLYRSFRGKLLQQKGDTPPGLKLVAQADLDSLWQRWIVNERFFGNPETREATLPPTDRPILPGKGGVPGTWIPVLKARGWTVYGPESDWKGGF